MSSGKDVLVSRTLALILLISGLPLVAETVPGRYLVELEGEPALTAPPEAGKGGRQARPDRLAAVRSAQARVAAEIEAVGAEVVDAVAHVANVLVVETDEAGAQSIAGIPGVRRVRPVRLFRRLLDRAVVLQKVSEAWQSIGIENAGAGVRIGIIDTGIDTLHPGLQDPAMTPPEGFPKVGAGSDVANTNSKVIVARNYDSSSLASARDREGHGTGVAMIAAGRTVAGPAGSITGIAPKAFLGNYKVFPDRGSGAPEDAILKAIDDAVTDGMDIVNLSLGSYPAERPEEDVLARAVERASAAGVIVVVAAGNEGPDLGTIGSPAVAPSAIAVGNAYTDRIFASTVRFPGAAPYVSVPGSGSNGAASITGPLRDVAELDPSGLACNDLPPDSLRGFVVLILRGTCFFEQKLQNAERAGAIAAIVYTHAIDPNPSIMDVGTARLPAVMIGNADGLDLRARLQAAPGSTVTVGFRQEAVRVDPNRLSRSTSKGPSVDYSIKPEMLGVGASVYTATAGSGSGAQYQASSGTSFSAPMIAGAAAVLKAARPGLTPQQYRSLLINSATSFPANSAALAPVMHTGAGLLNLDAALRSTVAVSPPVLSFGASTNPPDMVRRLAVTNLGGDPDTFSVTVQRLSGSQAPEVATQTVDLTPGASQEIEVRFTPLAGFENEFSGFLLVRNSSGSIEARVPYWFGIPSKRTASFTVVDTNPNAADTTGSRQTFLVRPTDAIGLPVEELPVVSVTAGDGSVLGIRPSEFYPGFYYLEVRLGTTPGENTFLLEAAGGSHRITISGR